MEFRALQVCELRVEDMKEKKKGFKKIHFSITLKIAV